MVSLRAPDERQSVCPVFVFSVISRLATVSGLRCFLTSVLTLSRIVQSKHLVLVSGLCSLGKFSLSFSISRSGGSRAHTPSAHCVWTSFSAQRIRLLCTIDSTQH